MPTPPRPSPLLLVPTALYLLLWPALVMLLGGDGRWPEGWIFSGWFLALCGGVIGWLWVRDPALLAERFRRPGTGGQSVRDRVVVFLLLVGFLGWIALMPLDARRFGWTPRPPLPVEVAGGALLLLSAVLFVRSFTDNPYLSPLVRLQPERGQRVVSSGVYGLVRHPMYLAAVLMFLGGPLLVGAATALAAGVALSLLLAVRSVDEEKLLAAGLEGYEEYRRRVRRRLLPGLW